VLVSFAGRQQADFDLIRIGKRFPKAGICLGMMVIPLVGLWVLI
jgi:hypothetical protein